MNKVSYALGMSIARNMQASGVKNVEIGDFAKAFETVFNHGKTEMTPEEAQAELNRYFAELQGEQARAAREKGEKFLKENGKKEGVVTLPSGLQYKVLAGGSGKHPSPSDQVKCHYEGTLIDGTKFDSSYDRNAPATFGVTQVIPGWVEALQLMKEGDKWELYIPYNLAYGERGAGEAIPPYSTLVFTVELLEVC